MPGDARADFDADCFVVFSFTGPIVEAVSRAVDRAVTRPIVEAISRAVDRAVTGAIVEAISRAVDRAVNVRRPFFEPVHGAELPR